MPNSPSGLPRNIIRLGTKQSVNTMSWLPDPRMPIASQLPRTSMPSAPRNTMAVPWRYQPFPSGTFKITVTESAMSLFVAKILWPLTR